VTYTLVYHSRLWYNLGPTHIILTDCLLLMIGHCFYADLWSDDIITQHGQWRQLYTGGWTNISLLYCECLQKYDRQTILWQKHTTTATLLSTIASTMRVVWRVSNWTAHHATRYHYQYQQLSCTRVQFRCSLNSFRMRYRTAAHITIMRQHLCTFHALLLATSTVLPLLLLLNCFKTGFTVSVYIYSTLVLLL